LSPPLLNKAKPRLLKRLNATHQQNKAEFRSNTGHCLAKENSLPPESEWQGLAKLRETHRAGRMLWEAEPTAENRERLRQFGLRSVVFEPCANRPSAGDFLSVMSDNVANIAGVFEQPREN
jgi:hypothetical protein